MSLLFVDGFDHYSISQLTRKWTIDHTTFTTLVAGRYGGQALKRTTNSGGSADTVYRSLSGTPTSMVVGFNFYINQFGSNGGGEIIYLENAAGNFHLNFNMTTGGILSVKNQGTSVTLATATTALIAGVWYFLEFTATIASSTSGAVAAYATFGGSTITLLSNGACNTYGGTGASNVGRVALGVQGFNSVQFTYDDLYILDTAGSVNNTKLGAIRVATLYPLSAGDSSSWTPNGSANNYSCVNENPADDDTTCVSSSGSNAVDLYNKTSLAGSGSIYGAQMNLVLRIDDAGPHSVKDSIKSAGTTYDGVANAPTSSYLNYSNIWESDPATSAPWTLSNLNAAQIGAKAVS